MNSDQLNNIRYMHNVIESAKRKVEDIEKEIINAAKSKLIEYAKTVSRMEDYIKEAENFERYYGTSPAYTAVVNWTNNAVTFFYKTRCRCHLGTCWDREMTIPFSFFVEKI